mgnify:CR=1 FL=1
MRGFLLGFGFLLILSAFVLGILGCLQAIKRAHDFGASGWAVLLTLLPFVNVLWFFALALERFGILDTLGREHVFDATRDAIASVPLPGASQHEAVVRPMRV